MDQRPLNRALIVAAVVAALLLGFAAGGASRIAEALFGDGPDPRAIASSSLQAMRSQNRLTAFVARYVSVTTARTRRFGLSSERTLILPGDVRYELDLARLGPADLRWDAAARTLHVRLPEIEIAGPEVDLAAAREYGSGQVMAALTGSDARLDQALRQRAVAELRSQARAEVPMRLARAAARAAVERSFALPLIAAGIGDVRVVARFAHEGDDAPSRLDVSRSYNEVLAERRATRAAGE